MRLFQMQLEHSVEIDGRALLESLADVDLIRLADQNLVGDSDTATDLLPALVRKGGGIVTVFLQACDEARLPFTASLDPKATHGWVSRNKPHLIDFFDHLTAFMHG